MSPITIDPPTDVTNTQVVLHWTALDGIYKGGSAVDVDSYEIEWDQGNAGEWTSLTSVLATELTYTRNSLTGGVTYGYRIRSVNEYGSSSVWSEPTYVLYAQPPQQPSPPVVALEDLYVKVSWTLPFANYEDITSVIVLLQDSTSTFVEVTSLCNGADPDTFTVRVCLIPMYSFAETAELSLP